jgi:hypothetical protein
MLTFAASEKKYLHRFTIAHGTFFSARPCATLGSVNPNPMIEQVKAFNARRRQDHAAAVRSWTPARGGLPHLAMYVYGDRKKGWIATYNDGRSSRLFPNRLAAINFINSL